MTSELLLLRIRDEAQQALERIDLRGEKIDLICYLLRCLREQMKWPQDGTDAKKPST